MNKVAENPLKNRTINHPYALMVVTAVFVTLYLVANIMAVKIIGFGRWFYFDAGTLTFPLAYMLGDVLTEVWGFKTAKRVIWLTFFCNVLMVACTQLAVWFPSPDYLETTAQAYNTIFTYVPRIVVASLVGFLLGELSNAWFMDKIKQKTKGKRMWVRTISSSAIAYWFDTLPFVLIAFLGVVSARELLLMIALQYVVKLLIEVVFGTPLFYATIHFLRKHFMKTGW